MSHHPFEDWLFADPSEEPLSSQQREALQAHLQECESCRCISAAWQEVEGELKLAPVLAPAHGFTSRFQARLEADRQRFQRRQSLALLLFSIAGAMLLLGSLLILAFPLFDSPSTLFWTWVYRIAAFVSYADTIDNIFLTLFRTAVGSVPWIWWVFAAGVASELAVLWVVSLRLLMNPRRVTQ